MSTHNPSSFPEPNQTRPFYQPPESRPFEDELQLVYQQIGIAYQNIVDFRGKLLGFLPFVTGSSFLLTLLSDPQKRLALEHLVLPFGFLGAIITIGLFFYEEEHLMLSKALAEEGEGLEKTMQLAGPFTPMHSRLFNAQNVSALVYAASFAGWICLALWFALPGVAIYVSLVVLLISWPLAMLRRKRLHMKASTTAKDRIEAGRLESLH